ncbi:thiamine pyrophosphate-binding protein [Saccharomonospora piscinae]|uniref:thiamine pyrophosphate-binding protein n=1 Tax=Saccharomonospora piscinae TaxID=687388 RepID=UPI001106046D|nr:thiamine pyrophosphate-binding protein [Saccharomonospora piscinae]TLW91978.1 thiamine pyrophosphate-binding protein [Saccharomonospora piscinae]
MSVTGAHSLVKALTELGVEVAFGLPGAHTLPLWDALMGSGIRLIGVRHEQAAAHAADGYARTTGSLGVALVATGPGAVNTLGALGEARAAASPVLVIATDVPSAPCVPATVRISPYEAGDQHTLFAPLSKATFTVGHADAIAAVVRESAAVATRPQSGPVYVGIPADFLAEPVAEPEPGGSAPAATSAAPVCPAPVEEELDRARAMLLAARRPLVWAGGGALRSGAGAVLGELAERLAAPIITTLAARGLVPPDHPCLASNPVHTPEVGGLWDEADVVLAVGTDFDGLMTQNWRMPQPPELIAVNVDADDAARHYPPDVLLLGDATDVVTRLSDGVEPQAGLDELTRRLDDIEVRVRRRVRQEEPHAAEFLSALKETLPDGAVLVPDLCVAGYWIGGFHRVSGPRQLACPMGAGAAGFALPAAIGIAAGGTTRAVCVTGDGGFLSGCAELATAVQESLAVTVVIVDDGGYGMLRYGQAHSGFEPHGVDLVTPDFVGLARSFGVDADRVDGFGRAFRRRLREFSRSTEPNVLAVGAELRPPLNTSPRWYRNPAAPW